MSPYTYLPRRYGFPIAAAAVAILILSALFFPNSFPSTVYKSTQLTVNQPILSSPCRAVSGVCAEPSALLAPLLPAEYTAKNLDQPFCNDRFGIRYLQGLSDNATRYCTENSGSLLTCFHSRTAKEGRTDSFCIGEGSLFEHGRFGLNCQARELSSEEVGHRTPGIENLAHYWYNTGPGAILRDYVNLSAPAHRMVEDSNFTILVRREENIFNPWHSLMEIFSLSMTLDVLRMTMSPHSHSAFLGPSVKSRVLILDQYAEGPYWDLWTLFAPGGIERMEDAKTTAVENIIIPLAGGSNPFWQGDWEAHACSISPLLRVFSGRILDFYKISHDPVIDDRPLVLTFIDRREKRRLVNIDSYIKALQRQFPAVKIQTVDFASISFEDQARISSETDILAGVHGAGLTHAMFQKPGSALVEIIPKDFNFKGFRNLAKLAGHQYFSAHASQEGGTTSGTKGGWQHDDVDIEEDRFSRLMEIAIKSMYQRGRREEDVV
ncbi:hypothetical protein EG328_005296 [Venturia inaequalis]|uniref:EGF domain-specific O-linked N-acetylglucosamine transferase n=1 Tax=Venturia inaequalis TaxID=5025 RepID=A0A8H3UKH2_VENIN|nr:hypothetical protein EG328_005296 [Venturia inaequalis]